MTIKDVKSEARQKLPINLHQAIIVYLIEYVIFVTLAVLVLTAGLLCADGGHVAAAVLIFLYGVVILCLAAVFSGVIGFAMSDFYLATYRCRPYNIRRLADVVSRNGIGKIIKMNLVRAVLGFLLLLLFVVPGVFYLTRTSMANYLLNANPNMKPTTALKASGKVMSGKMGKYVGMMFSMLGWLLIGVLTLGIGFIFVMPYINMVKASYYKRILAGDKEIYTVPVQTVSPVPEPAQQVIQQARPARPAPAQQANEHYVPPVEALNVDDVQDMNQAIIDFGGEPVEAVSAEIPEVPITPPRSAAPQDAPTEPVSDMFVETVKPLSTQEVDAAHVYDRKVEEMFSGAQPVQEPPQDYMSQPVGQGANDFVTQDVGIEVDEPPVVQDITNGDGDEESVESVMSDEDFAAFIRGFDVPTPEAKFTPLKQRKTIERAAEETPNVEAQSFAEPAKAEEVPPSVEAKAETPHERPSIRPSATARPSVTPRPRDTASSGFDREKARREREERLKNLRRK